MKINTICAEKRRDQSSKIIVHKRIEHSGTLHSQHIYLLGKRLRILARQYAQPCIPHLISVTVTGFKLFEKRRQRNVRAKRDANKAGGVNNRACSFLSCTNWAAMRHKSLIKPYDRPTRCHGPEPSEREPMKHLR